MERGHLTERDAAVKARALLEVIQHCHSRCGAGLPLCVVVDSAILSLFCCITLLVLSESLMHFLLSALNVTSRHHVLPMRSQHEGCPQDSAVATEPC